jgi:hypothetical protein
MWEIGENTKTQNTHNAYEDTERNAGMPIFDHCTAFHLDLFLVICLEANTMPPSGADCCIPKYWAEPGHEDPVAFCAQGNQIYVVMSGTVCGVFSSE